MLLTPWLGVLKTQLDRQKAAQFLLRAPNPARRRRMAPKIVHLERLEERTLLSSIAVIQPGSQQTGPDSWTGAGDGSSWGDGNNWSGGVPTATSDVVINGSSQTVVYSGGALAVNSLVLSGAGTTLALNGGTGTGGFASGSFTIEGGATLEVDNYVLTGSVAGAGTVQFAGANAIEGPYNITGQTLVGSPLTPADTFFQGEVDSVGSLALDNAYVSFGVSSIGSSASSMSITDNSTLLAAGISADNLSVGSGSSVTANGGVATTGLLSVVAGGSLSARSISAQNVTLGSGGTIDAAGETTIAGTLDLTGNSGSLSSLTTGSLNLGASAVVDAVLNGSADTGSSNGQVDVVGTGGSISLGGATLNLTLSGNPVGNQTYTLIHNGTGAAVSGVFGNAANGTISVDGLTYDISSGAAGVDIVLSHSPLSATNGSLSTSEDQAVAGAVSVSNPQGFPLTYALVSNPGSGVVSLNPSSGAFTYAPIPNTSGIDRFQVQVSDGQDPAVIVTETVSVAPETPVTVVLNSTGAGSQSGIIDVSGDADLYSITANVTGLVQVDVKSNTAQGSVLDSTIQILNSQGAVLGSNSNGGGALDSQLTFSATAGQQFTLRVAAADSALGAFRTGAYTVNVATSQDVLGFANAQVVDMSAIATGGSAQLNGTIASDGQKSLFSFTAPVTGFLAFSPATTGISSNTIPFAYSASEALLQIGSFATPLQLNVIAGNTYYLQVAAGGGATGSFSFTASQVPDDGMGHTFNSATALSLSGGTASLTGGIDVPRTGDYLTIKAPANGLLTVTEAAANDGSHLSPWLFAYDSSQQLITANSANPSQVQFLVNAGQTYYVWATGANGTTGDYTLSANLAAKADDGIGHTFIGATPINVSAGSVAAQAGQLGTAGLDIFTFTAPATGQVAIAAVPQSGGGLAAGVQVFDGNLTRIGSADSASAGLAAALTINVTQGETYYVKLFSDSGSGAYTLQLLATPGPASSTVGALSSSAAADLVQHLDAAIVNSLALAGPSNLTTSSTTQSINSEMISNFVAMMGGLSSLPTSYVLIWFDPVDFVLTDSQSRQVGNTQSQGTINELGNSVLESTSGAADLLVIPAAAASNYSLQLVGLGGAARAGANFVSSSGTETITIQDTLLTGDTVVPLDFSPAPSGLDLGALGFGQNGMGGSGTGGLAGNAIGLLAFAALGNPFNRPGMIDGATDATMRDASGPEAIAIQQIIEWVKIIGTSPQTLLKNMATSVDWPFVGNIADSKWLSDAPAADADPQILDQFWEGLGQRLLGIPNLNLSGFEELFSRSEQPPVKKGDASPQNQTRTERQPGDQRVDVAEIEAAVVRAGKLEVEQAEVEVVPAGGRIQPPAVRPPQVVVSGRVTIAAPNTESQQNAAEVLPVAAPAALPPTKTE